MKAMRVLARLGVAVALSAAFLVSGYTTAETWRIWTICGVSAVLLGASAAVLVEVAK